jgi:hypothetical protein
MLVLKHPKHAEQLKTGFEMQDKAKQDSDFQAMGEVYSAATAKKYDVAAALMQRRIEGDKQAGQDTTHDQMIYDALSSGDPVQQKAASAWSVLRCHRSSPTSSMRPMAL